MVDRALVSCASELLVAGQPPAIASEINRVASRRLNDIENSRASPAQQEAGENAVTAALATMGWIAIRPWFDLVCPEEYFHAERGLHLKESNPQRTGEFRERHDLRVPLGDYVLRSMSARIDFFTDHLGRFWDRCFLAVQEVGQGKKRTTEKLFRAKLELDQSVHRLKEACLSGQTPRLREACTALTQVYAAYHPSPDLSWLGFPAGWGTGHAGLIRSCVRPPGEMIKVQLVAPARGRVIERTATPLCRCDVVQQVAAALDDISSLYRRPVETEDLIDWARQAKRLALVDHRPRSVFWEREKVAASWDKSPKLWEFLWALARKAIRGQPVDRDDLSTRDSPRAIIHRRSRLSLTIPAQLDALIDDVPTRGYRLRLAPDEIILLQWGADEQLVEVGAELTTLTCLARNPACPPQFDEG
jgi:hypothetical protein